MSEGAKGFSDAQIAETVLALNEQITLRRRASAAWLTAHGAAAPSVPSRPTQTELSVMTALAHRYGAALASAPHFMSVRDCIAAQGAVTMVQRALWGETPEDVHLAGRLHDALDVLEVLCGAWPHVFMGEAHAVIAAFGDDHRGDDQLPSRT
jgi:hypothetical protein